MGVGILSAGAMGGDDYYAGRLGFETAGDYSRYVAGQLPAVDSVVGSQRPNDTGLSKHLAAMGINLASSGEAVIAKDVFGSGQDVNLTALGMGVSKLFQGTLEKEASKATLAAGRSNADMIRRKATLQKLMDSRTQKIIAAKARAGAIASGVSAQVGGVSQVIAADAGQAAFMEDYKYFTSEYQARIVMADAQNQARQQAMSAGFNLLSGSILTAAAFL
jgi:hypothetical protein